MKTDIVKIFVFYLILSVFALNAAATEPSAENLQKLNETAKKYWNVLPSLSVSYGNQALTLAKQLKDSKQEVIALRYIGVGYMYMGNSDRALEYFFESLNLAKKINDKEDISAALNNVAMVYDNMGVKDKSLGYYMDSLKIDRERDDQEGVAISLNNIGVVYADLGKNAEALTHFTDALIICQKMNYKETMAMTLGNIGDVYKKMGNLDEALRYTSDGLKMSRESDNKKGIATKLKTIGEIYSKTGDYEKALPHVEESMKIAKEAQLKELIMENYKILSDIYSSMNDTGKALESFRQYSVLKDELLNKEVASKIEKSQTKYEIERREKEKELLNMELERLKMLKDSLLAGFVFILMIAYVMYRLYRIKKEAHKNIIILSKIGQEITSNLNLEMIFKTFYENISSLMVADGFGIGICNESDECIEYKFFIEKTTRLPVFYNKIRDSGCFAGWCVKNKKEVFVKDVEKEFPKYFNIPWTRRKNEHPQSFLYLPLMAKNVVLGVLNVQSYHKNAYTSYHLNILKTLGSYLAIALDNSNAYVQIESQKGEIEKNLKIINIEKEISERLLLNILPLKVANDLKTKQKTEPELFNDVTVFFSDIVGFTQISSMLDPKMLIDELNDIYTEFDNIMEKNSCERIKTIGDAYLAVCGLPVPNKNHAENIINASVEILRYMTQRNEISDIIWEIRIGVHTGKVIAGVVGVKKYIYDVFGDSINTASRMQTNGKPMKINVSESTYNILKDRFRFIARETLSVKGKGNMNMYFLDQ